MKKRLSLCVMILFYVVAGINHFIHVDFYTGIMPWYLPYPLQLVYLSGICEILFGALLFPVKTRKAACWLIIAMLLIFLLVHVQMIIDFYPAKGAVFWIAVLRLPLQYVFIRWALTISRTHSYKIFDKTGI